MQISKPMKQAAFAGNARSITGVTPLYKANGPSLRINSVNTSRMPAYVPAGAIKFNQNNLFLIMYLDKSIAYDSYLFVNDSLRHQQAYRSANSPLQLNHRPKWFQLNRDCLRFLIP